VEIYCEAPELREAVKLLAIREKLATKLAIELGASAETIVLDSPKVVPSEAAPSIASEPIFSPVALDAGELQPTFDESIIGEGVAATDKASELQLLEEPRAGLVMVTTRISAEFPLHATADAERLVEISDLKRRIVEADLPGLRELRRQREERAPHGLPARDQRCLCELGHPRFHFSSELTSAERQRLLAEAIAAAKLTATSLATAAGVELSSLKTLTAATPPAPPMDRVQLLRDPLHLSRFDFESNASTTNEATADEASFIVLHRVIVLASFEASLRGSANVVAAAQ
jgi:hypothetical protein